MLNLSVAFILVFFCLINRTNKTLNIIFVIFLFLLASNNLTSPDRDAYRIYYRSIEHISFKGNVEIGYQLLICLSKKIGLSINSFFYVYYGICFILFLKIQQNISECSAMVTSFYCLFPYILDVDQMRSMLGYLIVLCCISFQIKERKINTKFLIVGCLVGSLFQQSCTIYLVYLMCTIDSKKILKITMGLSLFLVFCRRIIIRLSAVIPFLDDDRVNNYFSDEK